MMFCTSYGKQTRTKESLNPTITTSQTIALLKRKLLICGNISKLKLRNLFACMYLEERGRERKMGECGEKVEGKRGGEGRRREDRGRKRGEGGKGGGGMLPRNHLI
jgi:hypothetical protein